MTRGSQLRRGPDHRDDGVPGLEQPGRAARHRSPAQLQHSLLGAAAIFLEERLRCERSPLPVVVPNSYCHLPSPRPPLSSSLVTKLHLNSLPFILVIHKAKCYITCSSLISVRKSSS